MHIQVENGVKVWQGNLPDRHPEHPGLIGYASRTDLHAADGYYEPVWAALSGVEAGSRITDRWEIREDGRAHQVIVSIETPAEIAAAEADAARARVVADVDAMLADPESDQARTAISAVYILAGALAVYHLSIPCGGYRGALRQIGSMQLSPAQQAMLGTTDAVYRAAIAECGNDETITEIWFRIKPQPQEITP
jgi:hypothetical protein